MFSRKSSLKYFKKSNLWKNSTGTNVFNPETLEARSYSHWLYLRKVNGKVVFNNYRYSPTTTQHQYALEDLLKELHIKVSYFVSSVRSLSNLQGILEDNYRKIYSYEWKLENNRLTNKTKEKYQNIVRQEKKDTTELITSLKIEDLSKSEKESIKIRVEESEAQSKKYNIEEKAKKKIIDKKMKIIKTKLMIEALPRCYK